MHLASTEGPLPVCSSLQLAGRELAAFLHMSSSRSKALPGMRLRFPCQLPERRASTGIPSGLLCTVWSVAPKPKRE